MMKIVKLSSRGIISEVRGIRKKQRASTKNIEHHVDKIIQTVIARGDPGLTYLTEKFDNVKIRPKDFEVKKSSRLKKNLRSYILKLVPFSILIIIIGYNVIFSVFILI